jgi:2-polyprenyl-3-methyl-5-hydroxy-6-metoxy-1,4-benzoquinol methylase
MITNTHQQLRDLYKTKPEGYYNQDRPEMLVFVTPGTSSILDIGCGDGRFARNAGLHVGAKEVWGIEPNVDSAAVAATVLDKVIAKGFAEDLPELSGKKFDCIIFNDVLEHMPEPESALQICKNHLNSGGYVVASIPNILFFPVLREIIQKQDWEYKDYGILDNTHLRFFTRKSIIRLFQTAGYKIETIKGISARDCGKLYKLLNLFSFGKLRDWKYMQFGLRAQMIN